MKRSVKWIGFVVFLSFMFLGGVLSAADKSPTSVATQPSSTTPNIQVNPPEGKCCIAGKYKGVHKDIASKTCPKPETADFIMEIAQDQKCGSNIKGTVTNPKDGSVNNFVGTVVPGKGECCNIQGSWRKPDEVTTFKGILCKKDGKWSGKGTYTSKYGTTVCNGTWEMSQ